MNKLALFRAPILGVALLALAAGCGRRSATETATEVRTFKLTGTADKVEKEAGSVTIRHDAIPGFMAAMTMPFDIKDKGVLDEVHPGDEVEGALRVRFRNGQVEDFELTDLAVTRPAPPPALRLNLSGERPALEPVPKLLEPGQEVPDFRMTTQEGKPLALSDLRGKVVVLTFIYTGCPLPDFCPMMDRKFAGLADHLRAFPARAEQVRFLSVSFDPEHDTPEVLRKHARTVGARPPLWTFAVASHEELGKVLGPLGLTYGPTASGIVHNLCTAVIDRQGRLALLRVGTAANRWQPAELLKPIADLAKSSK